MTKQTSKPKKHYGGRIKSPFDEFNKKLRATKEEQAEFLRLLREINPTGDTRQDFLILLSGARQVATLKAYSDNSVDKLLRQLSDDQSWKPQEKRTFPYISPEERE